MRTAQFLLLWLGVCLLAACAAAPESGPLEGRYAKLDPGQPQWWKCQRCADYRLSGGIWELAFEGGQMRIVYDVNGWHSQAAARVEDDLLWLTEDPYCPEELGEYSWSLDEAGLHLTARDDPCAFGLRAENLSKQVWLDCEQEADAPACASGANIEAFLATDAEVEVEVLPGDARHFEQPPQATLPANAENLAPPEGLAITFAEHSLDYGHNRVLWWEGPWIEFSGHFEADAIGVQFLGDPVIGWAEVYFDGELLWRGDTAAIWNALGRHGGYVQISGFAPGAHTLRVQAVGTDYRSVTVAFFGVGAAAGGP